ncbi:2313_t:CDS:1 [Acaulospora colombiana]|uniref:2313_t:CDS:1 n=1 Tax=Acaulospora colombiana TaxID=27376 RepID=A0ACA9JV59_9GLOM|nr:2313_t:CDS:1 [Acaulospora colombiana]
MRIRQESLAALFFLLSALFFSTTSTVVISNSPNVIHNIYPSTDLPATYFQSSNPDDVRHRIFDVRLNTKIPFLNLDKTHGAISSIECDSSIGSITLKLHKGLSESFIDDVKHLPSKVILIVSHRLNCFVKSTTQFFLTEYRTVDVTNRKVKISVEPCDILDWTDEFSFKMWGKESAYPQKLSPRSYNKRGSAEFSAPVSFDLLYDHKTRNSSEPNVHLASGLTCSNCFTKGCASISLDVKGHKRKINSAHLEIIGDFLANLDITAEGHHDSQDVVIFELPSKIPIIPGQFEIDSSLKLVANSKVDLRSKCAVTLGRSLSIQNFSLVFELVDNKINVNENLIRNFRFTNREKCKRIDVVRKRKIFAGRKLYNY